MRPSRRHPLPAAHERSQPPRLQRGERALPDRSRCGGGGGGMDESATRDALLLAVLRDVPFDGWSGGMTAAASGRLGLGAGGVAPLFPSGARDAVAAFSRWADREMLAALADQDLAAMKVRERIAAAARARLAVLDPHREAVRRALAVLALPHNLPLRPKLLYDTVDSIWPAPADTPPHFIFYPNPSLLAGLYPL